MFIVPSKRSLKAYEAYKTGNKYDIFRIEHPILKSWTDEQCKKDVYVENEIENFISNKVPKIEEYLSKEDKSNYVQIDEINYWREHPDLHGWMEELYYKNGGDEEFNCVDVVLNKDDVDKLVKDLFRHVNGVHSIEKISGFFFGESCLEDFKEDLTYFTDLLNTTDWDNETVYYSSWW